MEKEIFNFEKWKAFGFLDGLSEEDGIALADRFEELANFILQNEYDGHVEVMAFPALRRAFQRGLNEKYSPRALCEKIKKEYDDEVRKIKDKVPFNNIDAEAEYCAIVADYFSRDNKRK